MIWGALPAWADAASSECAQGNSCYQQGAYAQAAEHFNRAVRLAEPDRAGEAHFGLYRCYFNGKGVKADKSQAVKHLKKAAQARYAPACAELARYYETTEFPPIGNYEGRFRGEENFDGLPKDGRVYCDARGNGARFWSGEDTKMAIAAEWYAIAGEQTVCPCAAGHDLADFQQALKYFNRAVAIYPWMSEEREDIAKRLQGALRGERVVHDGVEAYRFVDVQEMRDSRLAPGELIWVMGIVEPRSSDGTGFYMRVKDSDKGASADVYIKLDTIKLKPRLGAQMVRGRYTPASEQWGAPVTLYEVEEIRDMTPAGNGEVWYKRGEI
ncbi:sel1 repeat family protein [bacterium]|nr:sel1 repeat family protein [bacterium]